MTYIYTYQGRNITYKKFRRLLVLKTQILFHNNVNRNKSTNLQLSIYEPIKLAGVHINFSSLELMVQVSFLNNCLSLFLSSF